jgi:glycosyltransferase involved in cell wall biosynthesis
MRKSRKRLRVLWAGRLCRQKNPELLVRIVENAPSLFHFDVWGRGDAAYEEQFKALAARRDNFAFRGAYDSFPALPAHEYDAFLYTSLWDGLPSVLLEAAACGLPIVAADVGAVHELVSARTGWLIREREDWRPYLAALVEIARDSLEAQARTRSMSDLLQAEHGWQGYRKTLSHHRSFVESHS